MISTAILGVAGYRARRRSTGCRATRVSSSPSAPTRTGHSAEVLDLTPPPQRQASGACHGMTRRSPPGRSYPHLPADERAAFSLARRRDVVDISGAHRILDPALSRVVRLRAPAARRAEGLVLRASRAAAADDATDREPRLYSRRLCWRSRRSRTVVDPRAGRRRRQVRRDRRRYPQPEDDRGHRSRQRLALQGRRASSTCRRWRSCSALHHVIPMRVLPSSAGYSHLRRRDRTRMRVGFLEAFYAGLGRRLRPARRRGAGDRARPAHRRRRGWGLHRPSTGRTDRHRCRGQPRQGPRG